MWSGSDVAVDCGSAVSVAGSVVGCVNCWVSVCTECVLADVGLAGGLGYGVVECADSVY